MFSDKVFTNEKLDNKVPFNSLCQGQKICKQWPKLRKKVEKWPHSRGISVNFCHFWRPHWEVWSLYKGKFLKKAVNA